mmetsp:Transcript_9906/g.21441  ORF Transcript_9906/g.21441 Transcript_9906/m.21441 type:complete len:110 (+) Transcript_9906:351-680(+)
MSELMRVTFPTSDCGVDWYVDVLSLSVASRISLQDGNFTSSVFPSALKTWVMTGSHCFDNTPIMKMMRRLVKKRYRCFFSLCALCLLFCHHHWPHHPPPPHYPVLLHPQ